MVQPLKHLPGLWDPGRTKLLHARRNGLQAVTVTVQAPHRQDVLMSATKTDPQWEILNLPLPYMYYFTVIEKYNDTLSVTVKGIGCSHSLKNLNTERIRVVPLPNTGIGLYTCSMPFYINELEVVDSLFKTGNKMAMPLVREIAKAAIVHFWQEGFWYLEKTCDAHKLLYSWGAANKSCCDSNAIDLKPFERWSKLKLKDLSKMVWLIQEIPLSYTKPWL